jgi:nucleotide-binding universal stress UspA family protein
MSVFQSLLVPLDGSQTAARALGCAAWLGTQLEARLHIVSAINCPASAREELIRLKVPASCWPQVTLHQATRVPEEAIRGVADEHDVGLIILSAHGEGASETAPGATALANVGHVARAVLEHSERPVLLLPDAYRERLPWTRILVPISAEGELSPAASLAVALANDLGLCVCIAHVLDDPSGRTGLEGAIRYADAPHHEYPEQLAEMVRRTVPNATAEECSRISGVVLLRGDIISELLQQIERKQVSLVVLGWNGSFLSGRAKVVKRLLATVTCPMLLVRVTAPGPFRLKVGIPAAPSTSAKAMPLPADAGVEVVYDKVDRRLMDTFPASDAVAQY